jgi:hypothetical protein
MKRCPKCREGDHSKHQYDYIDADGHVWLCRCQFCKLNRMFMI